MKTKVLFSLLFLCVTRTAMGDVGKTIKLSFHSTSTGYQTRLMENKNVLTPNTFDDKISGEITITILPEENKCLLSFSNTIGTLIKADRSFISCLFIEEQSVYLLSYLPNVNIAFYQQIRHLTEDELVPALGRASILSLVLAETK